MTVRRAEPYRPYARIEGQHTRTIVVGDVHGCWEEFQQLLSKVDFQPDDVLVSVGDFLDRGPGSWNVAHFFRDTPNAYSVVGNHERRVAGTIRGTSQPAWSQKQTLSLIEESSTEGWGEFIESLPAVLETDHAIITHARLDPAISLTEQDAYFTAAVGGPSVTIELDGNGVPLWYRAMSIDKPVCMGHVGYDRIELVPDGLYALDTKACQGGFLTAVIFPEGKVMQVKAARDYVSEARARWKRRERKLDQSPLSWPMSHVSRVMRNGDNEDPEMGKALNVISAHIEGLRLEEMETSLRAKLHSLFGPPPPPGQARGEYYKAIMAEFPTQADRALVKQILTSKRLDLASLAHVFPQIAVQDLQNEIQLFDDLLTERTADEART